MKSSVVSGPSLALPAGPAISGAITCEEESWRDGEGERLRVQERERGEREGRQERKREKET